MTTNDGTRPAQRHGDASEPVGEYPRVGQTVLGAIRAIRVTPNPIFDEPRRPQIVSYPMAPTHAAIWAIRQAHWQRLIANPEHPYHWLTKVDETERPHWWSMWAGDPYADIRTELAGYVPDDAEVTLAGIRALVGAR